ncbi:MAG: PDZ domain-containing protein [Clostridia bacterium]|nr:PDZ domain-containing protein [Clostridia bacterium]
MKREKETNKKTYGKYILISLITAVITLAVAFVAVFFWVSNDTKLFKLKQMDLFTSNFYGDIDEQKIEDGIIRGYISGLEDKYAGYYTADENKDRSDRLEGQAVGIGIIVVEHPDNHTIYVKHVYDNCPAAKAGIKAGDEIIAIDGVTVTERGYDNSVNDILREIGSTVELTLLRGGEELSVSALYSSFMAQSVFAKMIGDYGFIEITSFNTESIAQFKNAVNSLKTNGAKGLIFDLRGNGGGTVESVTEMLDFLMPEGVLMTVKYGNGKVETYAESDSEEIELPMVVLVDGATASASELFSATVRDFNKGVLIGSTTYGKGVMQSTFGFTDGSAAVFTIAEFFSHSGESFNEVGLTPDIEVKLNEEQKTYFHLLSDDEDPVKQAAVEWLKKQ